MMSQNDGTNFQKASTVQYCNDKKWQRKGVNKETLVFLHLPLLFDVYKKVGCFFLEYIASSCSRTVAANLVRLLFDVLFARSHHLTYFLLLVSI